MAIEKNRVGGFIHRTLFSIRSREKSDKYLGSRTTPLLNYGRRAQSSGRGWQLGSADDEKCSSRSSRVFPISSGLALHWPRPPRPKHATKTAENGLQIGFQRGKRIGRRHDGFGGFRNRCGTAKIINQMADSYSGAGGVWWGGIRGEGCGYGVDRCTAVSVMETELNGNLVPKITPPWSFRRCERREGAHKRKLETRPTDTPLPPPPPLFRILIAIHRTHTHSPPYNQSRAAQPVYTLSTATSRNSKQKHTRTAKIIIMRLPIYLYKVYKHVCVYSHHCRYGGLRFSSRHVENHPIHHRAVLVKNKTLRAILLL